MSAPWYRIERLYLYLYRTRRPSRWGRHNGYAGITNRPDLRDGQHKSKSWYDLVTKRYVWCIGVMPRFVGLALERLLIALTWPVYNVQGNRWNPRRIKPRDAALQRAARDGARLAFADRARLVRIKINMSPLSLAPLVGFIVGALVLWSR